MKKLGEFHITEYSTQDERPHPKTDDPLWQESMLLHWYDDAQGMGGLLRIGHEPNKGDDGKGTVDYWLGFFTNAGVRYRRQESDIPLVSGDRFETGQRSGELVEFRYEDKPYWRLQDGDLDIELAVDNFFPLINAIDADMGTLKDFAPCHGHSSGRASGRVRLKDETFAINGFCYRDHSWGRRNWKTALLSHRWFAGTFGPQLSFSAITWHGADGKLDKFGYIVRGDEIAYTRDIDVVVYIEADGITHRGGQVRFTLADGTVYEIECEAVDGAIFFRNTIACVDIICKAKCNGMEGYCNVETTNNARLGSAPVTLALRADIGSGLRFDNKKGQE